MTHLAPGGIDDTLLKKPPKRNICVAAAAALGEG